MAGNLTAMIASIFSGGVTADPYYEYTTLLLPGSGTNGAQNNTFLDGSTNNFTITRNGNTTQGTFSPFSQTGWGNYFDGTGDYLSIADNAVLRLGTSAFTIECWIYRSASGAAHSIAAKGGATTGWLLEVTSGNLLQFTHGTTTIASTGTVSANTWVHVAAVREGTGSNQFKLYINGTNDGTGTVSTDFTQTETLYVAANRSAGTTMNGYVSNFRLTNGAALYTATFTPATSELTTTSQGASSSQVELLTCQSNRFIDNSTNNFTITRNGDTRVVAFSPFNPTASWAAATYGGSGYFDGSGDYLTYPPVNTLKFGTNDFTVETWVYRTGAVDATWGNYIIDARDASNTASWFLFLSSAAANVVWFDGANFFGSGSAPIGAWTHIVYCRSGTTGSMFVNGTRTATQTDSKNYTVTGTTAYIGSRYTLQGYQNGYLSGLRVVNGTAVYDPTQTTLTVPTAPLTAITNTSLLLNFTNAGIYDATSKNDLETVGNAQIVAPTPTKWGGGSMAFDGTTDYLVEPTSVYFGYGTGDFTIEFWVYFNSTGTSTIFSNLSGTASTNPHIYINSTIRFYNGGGDRITSSTSPSTGVWYHLAVCRASGSTRMFLDGTQTGATYADTNDYGQSAPLGVGTYWNGGAPVTASTLNGYLQDVRVSKYARYTTNFTPPTAAFPTL